MQTQIKCPACNTPYVADVHQIIDVGLNPELKQMLLGGYLNVAQCPSCGAMTQVTTPLLYHDPEHELFLVYVPMEMGLAHNDQEELIGQLVRRSMDQLPPEQRRGYMFQPKTILSLQSLMEEVLETEGITPEMIERQRQQLELLQTLLSADKETTSRLLNERADDIDETFFVFLRSMMEAAESNNQEDQLLKLVNLQARLYRETPYGQSLEKQQQALHALSREANKAGGLSPKLLLKHILAYRSDQRVINSLVSMGFPAFNYEFFVLLSDKIEKREKSGIGADELIALRDQLLQLQQDLQRESREMVDRVQQTIHQILEADDKIAAIRKNLNNIDEFFLNVLATMQEQALKIGDDDQAAALQEVQELIITEIEKQAPPELRLLNHLLRTEDDEDLRDLLEENSELITPDLLQLVRALDNRTEGEGNKELSKRLNRIERMVSARIPA